MVINEALKTLDGISPGHMRVVIITAVIVLIVPLNIDF